MLDELKEHNILKLILIVRFSCATLDVSYLHRKGMKLPAVVAELAAVSHEDAFDENRVKY
jgi:hypothetical protein